MVENKVFIPSYTPFEVYKAQQLYNGIKDVAWIEGELEKGNEVIYPSPDPVHGRPIYVDKTVLKAIKGGLLGVYKELAETQKETAEGIVYQAKENRNKRI